jgi:hypothetical protein
VPVRVMGEGVWSGGTEARLFLMAITHTQAGDAISNGQQTV